MFIVSIVVLFGIITATNLLIPTKYVLDLYLNSLTTAAYFSSYWQGLHFKTGRIWFLKRWRSTRSKSNMRKYINIICIQYIKNGKNREIILVYFTTFSYLLPKLEGVSGTAEKDPKPDFGSSSGCCWNTDSELSAGFLLLKLFAESTVSRLPLPLKEYEVVCNTNYVMFTPNIKIFLWPLKLFVSKY